MGSWVQLKRGLSFSLRLHVISVEGYVAKQHPDHLRNYGMR